MNISQVQSNINFKSKKRFLDSQQQSYLKEILRRMNLEVKYAEDNSGMQFVAKLIGDLSLNNANAQLIDNRYYFFKESKADQMSCGRTELIFNKIKLQIDNTTSEIVSWDKPFFTRWKTVMKNLSNTLKNFKENYSNRDVVTKHSYRINGLTEKGALQHFNFFNYAPSDGVVRKFILKEVK